MMCVRTYVSVMLQECAVSALLSVCMCIICTDVSVRPMQYACVFLVYYVHVCTS